MRSGQTLFPALAAAVAIGPAQAANAFEFRPYDAAAVKQAIRSGAPVVVHIHAPWCLQCRAQEQVLADLAGGGAFARIRFFRVDYDAQKAVVSALNVSRSTLIAYKGGREAARMSWGTSPDDIAKVLRAAD